MTRTKKDDTTIKIFVTPFGKTKFSCRLEPKYKPDTPEKELAFIVALGIRQLSRDDPDLVYGLGRNVYDLLKENNELESKIIKLYDWRDKLN